MTLRAPGASVVALRAHPGVLVGSTMMSECQAVRELLAEGSLVVTKCKDTNRFYKWLQDHLVDLRFAGLSAAASNALDAANNQKTLTSPTDFRRLQSIESGITGVVNRPQIPGQLIINHGARVVPIDDEEPGWLLPSTNKKVVLRIDPELLDRSKSVPQQNELPQAPELNRND